MNQDAIVALLREEVPAEIERWVPRHLAGQAGWGRCIQATRVGLEVLRYFGVEARPLVTLLITGNRAWAEWMLDGSPQPMPDEAWAVGIDDELHEGQRGFPGHLVIELDGQLLDLDAGFYARPERGIFVPPTVLVEMTPVEETGALAGTDLAEGGALLYGQHRGTPVNFRGTGAWKHTVTWAGPVIRRMRDQLLCSPAP